jgi:two-component system cell cycle sensor histidine kinase/response regulator CckA
MSLIENRVPDRPLVLIGAILGAMLASAALLWFATSELIVVIAYVLGLVFLALVGFAIDRMRAPAVSESFADPDWSVTVAAIDQPGEAIAITDRASRLVCANSGYSKRFGANDAPPNLLLSQSDVDALTRIARTAWREGRGGAELFPSGENEPGWSVSAERAGRGEDYMIWRFRRIEPEEFDPLADMDVSGAFGRMLSNAGIEVAITASDGVINSASAGFAERASGDASATLVGQEFVSFLRSDERDRIYFAREGRGGTPQTLVQVPFNLRDGASGISSTGGQSLMLLVDSGVGIGGSWDGSAQTGALQLEALLAQLPLGLAMTDRDGRFLFGNEAFLRSVNREGLGLPPFPTDLVVREDKSALSDAVRRHGRGPATSGDMAVRLASQPDEPVSLGLAGVRGLGDAAVLLSLADSTEETRLKRQVAQATKMQAVGQLAGGVAHDFNNVLTAIIGTCDLMLLRHTPGDSDYDDIQQIRANSNRAASLTRQLLAFSRQQTLRPEILQLPDVVSEVGPLIKRLLGEKIEYRVRHDRDLGPVRADPQQLEQVIMNLAVNARDAIQSSGDGAGQIKLSTRTLLRKDVEQMRSNILPAEDYTVLLVEDTGGGIPSSVLPKLFEPFFTTKEQGKGTGLGLSTVYGIVKQSGGFIFADNIDGENGKQVGARFTIYLPVYKGEMPSEAVEPDPAETAQEWSSGGRLLLVEDEDMVRAVAERALGRAGYSVTACSDGEEGLAQVEAGEEFDLIVSDVVMPGMDGPTMARAIRELRPEIPVLFMSGYAEEHLRQEIDIPNMHFIGKPFSVQEIGDTVSYVLRKVSRQEN